MAGIIVAAHGPRKCQNERCGRWYVGREEPHVVEAPRGVMQMYCSYRCTEAQKQRNRRRRLRDGVR
jgi:hypothetical protein